MSTCISKHGEFGAHEPDADYVCTLCGVLDEEGLITELRNALARVAELERQRDQVLAIVAREPIDARRAYDDIRKIHGGGPRGYDGRDVLMQAYERDAAAVEAAGRGKEDK